MILAVLLGRKRRAQARQAKAEFLEHLPLIERVATRAASQGGFKGPDVEDFVSQIKLKLIDDDYAVLRQRRGDSTVSTFLITVIHNEFRDYRNHKWGKYRSTVVARRLGPDAVRLESLIVRDRLPVDTAIEMLRASGVQHSHEALYAMAERLPDRVGRSEVDDAVLKFRGVDGAVEQRVEDHDRSATATEVERVLAQSMAAMAPQDVLLLRMHLRDGVPISRLATMFGDQQRALYARKDRALLSLRLAFLAQGLTWPHVREILDWEGLDWTVLDDRNETLGNATAESV